MYYVLRALGNIQEILKCIRPILTIMNYSYGWFLLIGHSTISCCVSTTGLNVPK